MSLHPALTGATMPIAWHGRATSAEPIAGLGLSEPGYAAMRCLSPSIPCGSRTYFLLAPLSKAW